MPSVSLPFHCTSDKEIFGNQTYPGIAGFISKRLLLSELIGICQDQNLPLIIGSQRRSGCHLCNRMPSSQIFLMGLYQIPDSSRWAPLHGLCLVVVYTLIFTFQELLKITLWMYEIELLITFCILVSFLQQLDIVR